MEESNIEYDCGDPCYCFCFECICPWRQDKIMPSFYYSCEL
jgi:hypothetical protein